MRVISIFYNTSNTKYQEDSGIELNKVPSKYPVFAVLLIVVTGITIASLSSASGRSLISQLFPVSQTDNPESPVDGGSIQEVSVSGHVVVSVMRQGNEVYRF
ncbi:MAG: hypothetical protein ACREBU_12995, partial [Nitrososphaera sp.]